MRVACVGYRDWALAIYDEITKLPGHEFMVIRSKDEYAQQDITDFRPDLALFYGWSWQVDAELTDNLTCLMLHPSPLPLYRGGSPIQNQIIRGETESAVSIFIMNEELDAGNIVAQAPLSLEGHLDEIFARITRIGAELTKGLIENGYEARAQNHDQATVFSRRKPADSEITLEELQEKDAEYLYNKIRMLEDPYPNAFIRCADGRKLLIKCAELEDASQGAE